MCVSLELMGRWREHQHTQHSSASECAETMDDGTPRPGTLLWARQFPTHHQPHFPGNHQSHSWTAGAGLQAL